MGHSRQSVRWGLLVALSSVFVVGTATTSSATGNIVKSDLKGTWQITLHGRTACGFVTMLASVTFGTTGVGTGPLTTHGDCGDSTADQTFTVTSLKANGAGTATLTCGAACAGGLWHFDIQVAPDRTKFNLADVTFTDTDSFIGGVAIVGSIADNIVVADLKGEWSLSLAGHQFGTCGAAPLRTSGTATLTLNDAGTGNANARLKTNCGSFDDPLNPFTVLSLTADGRGTAQLDCGGGCELTFSIQVSPDRSMMNLVTVSSADPGDMLAGVAIRRSTGGHIVKANLTGPWRGTIVAEELDGDIGVALATLKFNAQGSATNVTIVLHDTEGDGTMPGCALTATVSPDGSGTLAVTCGTDPPVLYSLQVSPDRSTMSIVDVSADTEDLLVGVVIHQ